MLSKKELLLAVGLIDWSDTGWVYGTLLGDTPVDPDEGRQLCIGIVTELISEGLVIAGDYDDSVGFIPWEMSPGDSIVKIALIWPPEIDGKWPDLSGIFWLKNTLAGREVASQALAREGDNAWPPEEALVPAVVLSADIKGSWLAQLIRSIGVLALPYEGQQAWLVGMWDIPGMPPVDELATEFGDAAALADQMVDAQWIGSSTLDMIQHLDAYLEQRSGQPHTDFWTYTALREHPDWQHIRKLALEILIDVGDVIRIPST